MKKLFVLLVGIVHFMCPTYGQSDSALAYRVASQTFEECAANNLAAIISATGDSSEGSGARAFLRWIDWAENHRSIVPYGEDVFKPFRMELEHFITSPGAYCTGSSPTPASWKCIGPYNNYYGAGIKEHAGRVNSVWANPSNIGHMRAAANTGGLWESKDTGHTWRCITDHVTTGPYGVQIPGTIAISEMAVSPLDTNIIYLRLNKYGGLTDKSYGYDMGIIHTYDGGANWYKDAGFSWASDPLPIPTFPKTSGMKFMPGTNKIFTFKDNRIFYDDGTTSWVEISPGTGVLDKMVTDVEFTTTSPGKALFSANNTDNTVHIYSYTYTTDTWSDINITIAAPYDTINWDYISDMSISTGDTVFMLLNGHQVVEHQLLIKMPLSTGVVDVISFDPKNTVGSTGSPFEFIKVSPINTRVVYATNHDGERNFYRSTDRGVSFSEVQGTTHADARALFLYTPASYLDNDGDVLIGGTDGGVVMKKAGEVYFRSITGDSLVIQEFYGLAVSDLNDGLIEGGSHDNGGFTYVKGRSPEWQKETSLYGDNYLSAFARKGVQTAYTGINMPDLKKVTITGTTAAIASILNPGDVASTEYSPANNYQRPFHFDEHNNAYVGYRKVWKKTLAATSWSSSFSPVDVTGNPMISDMIVADNSNLDTAFVAYRRPGDWTFFGTPHPYNQKLFWSYDANPTVGSPTWNDITPRSIGLARINDIEVAPDNAARM